MSATEITSELFLASYGPSAHNGGVELHYEALLSAQVRAPWADIQMGSRQDAVRWARTCRTGRRAVFTQSAGMLSSRWQNWILELDSLGVVVVEENVFNLPSQFRPAIPNHRLVLQSYDGLIRFVLRSVLGALRPPARAFVQHNPLLHADVAGVARHRATSNTTRMLRVGRPDPRKWTSFELDFCTLLAAKHPTHNFELTLIGAPESLSIPEILPNLKITRMPYAKDVAALYDQHDVYVHNSRIGEAFGNTLAEAAVAGLLVVCALDPLFDCAPTEFLRAPHLVRTPQWLLHAAQNGQGLELLTNRPTRPSPPVTGGAYLAALASAAFEPPDAFGVATPGVGASLAHLRSQAEVLGDPYPRVTTAKWLLRESARQVANRRQTEPFSAATT